MSIDTTATTATLRDLTRYIRSKNAGPFWVTVDIFFADPTNYDRVVTSGAITTDVVAALYKVPEELVKIFHIDNLSAIKVSFPRTSPQGSITDSDMHAAQQFIPLQELRIGVTA